MRFLITGGCGFLGSNLASEVLSRGEDLCVFDNLSRMGGEKNLTWLENQGSFQFINKDVRNAVDVENAIKDFRPDVIYHLAGQVAMTTSISDPRADFEINALGTINVLEAVRQHMPETIIIYSSTNKVYGDLEWVHYNETESRYIAHDYPDGFDENTPLKFSSPYGCSKGAADQYMLDYAKMYDLKTVVFRHSSMYGGRQFATYDQGWIGWFCQQAVLNKKENSGHTMTISGNGKQVRDVLHGDDMRNLYFAAVEKINDSRGQVFNVGGGMQNSLSLLELFTHLEKILDVQLQYDRLPPRESDQKIFIADLGKAKRLLEWEPLVSAEDGLRDMVKWVSGDT
jgi:CDP-paratose 2-epimerase